MTHCKWLLLALWLSSSPMLWFAAEPSCLTFRVQHKQEYLLTHTFHPLVCAVVHNIQHSASLCLILRWTPSVQTALWATERDKLLPCCGPAGLCHQVVAWCSTALHDSVLQRWSCTILPFGGKGAWKGHYGLSQSDSFGCILFISVTYWLLFT